MGWAFQAAAFLRAKKAAALGCAPLGTLAPVSGEITTAAVVSCCG
jgi:hypothetical protein